MKIIGIHLPDKAHFHDKSDYMFVDELIKVIDNSGRYKALRLNLENLNIFSEKEAKLFKDKENLHIIVQHDSHFYSKNNKYKNNVYWLEKCIPFMNSIKSQEIGHDKILTNKILRENKIPVLDHVVVNSREALQEYMQEDSLYVVKPHSGGAGAGVRLIKKQSGEISRFINGKWRKIEASNGKKDIEVGSICLQHKQNIFALSMITLMFCGSLLITLTLPYLTPFSMLFCLLSIYFFIIIYDTKFIYRSMIVEPYFNDHSRSFSSLRCTVIGNEVVESVKRTNQKNITSNISSGGTAEKVELSNEQKKMAVDAKNVIGADYAGVDLLVCGDESVVGEVNIGPFTLFCTYTGVNVGKLFGDYLIKKCDNLS